MDNILLMKKAENIIAAISKDPTSTEVMDGFPSLVFMANYAAALVVRETNGGEIYLDEDEARHLFGIKEDEPADEKVQDALITKALEIVENADPEWGSEEEDEEELE